MTSTPAVVSLERKLARDPAAILTTAEVKRLASQIHREFVMSFGDHPMADLSRIEDTVRWRSLAAKCAEARGRDAVSDMAVATRIPRYRLKAIESGQLPELRADLAWRYFRALGIEVFVERWCRANAELAARSGLVSAKPRASRRSR